jgi:predicted translin family RNA/ssDNA-binding protein
MKMDGIGDAKLKLMELASSIREHLDNADGYRSEAADQAGGIEDCASQAVGFLDEAEGELDQAQAHIREVNNVLNTLDSLSNYPTLAKFMQDLQGLIETYVILFPKLEEKKDAVEE